MTVYASFFQCNSKINACSFESIDMITIFIKTWWIIIVGFSHLKGVCFYRLTALPNVTYLFVVFHLQCIGNYCSLPLNLIIEIFPANILKIEYFWTSNIIECVHRIPASRVENQPKKRKWQLTIPTCVNIVPANSSHIFTSKHTCWTINLNR